MLAVKRIAHSPCHSCVARRGTINLPYFFYLARCCNFVFSNHPGLRPPLQWRGTLLLSCPSALRCAVAPRGGGELYRRKTPGASSNQDCSDKVQWQEANSGYQSSVPYAFVCRTCLDTPDMQYRCAPGYYGSSTNGTSGCTQCPSSDGLYGTTDAGATAITSCHIPSGTIGNNITGSFTYTSNCYYSN